MERERIFNPAAPHDLERAYIAQYLRSLGYAPADIPHLPKPRANELMRGASLYASARLAEVETRSHLVEDIHGGTPPM